MKVFYPFCFTCIILCLALCHVNAQQKIFNKVINDDKEPHYGFITSIAQDREGYMWFGSSEGGLLQYDGSKISSITNNPKNSNSLANNYAECLFIDSLDIFWIGTFGSGLDRYDRANNKFTHFRHNTKNGASLTNDTVTAILQDRSGNLWVGTYNGLDVYNAKTNTFAHYTNKPNDATSLSSNIIRIIYEDRQGTLWIGCGSPFGDAPESPEAGGLNRLDKHTGKFTRYLHDPHNPNSIANNKISAICEDSKGNFWVGTRGDGLHTLNRTTGLFTHYYYDSAHPEKLSRPPFMSNDSRSDFISFIKEDAKGDIWIGSQYDGINQYDPLTKKITHHGYKWAQGQFVADSASGLTSNETWRAFIAKDGLLWVGTFGGSVYTVNANRRSVIPYFRTKQSNVLAFYEEKNGSLWIGTFTGLVHKDIAGKEKIFLKNPLDKNGLNNNMITSIQPDSEGKLWLATWGGGINKFDPVTQTFTHYVHDAKRNSLSSNYVTNLLFDHNKNLWIATDSGLNKLDLKSGFFSVYKHNAKDSDRIYEDFIYCLLEDQGDLWLGTGWSIEKFDKTTGKFKNYLKSNTVSLFNDKEGVLWAGAWFGPSSDGLYRYDKTNDSFIVYTAANGNIKIKNVGNVIGDNQNNLWVSAYDAIYKISSDRNSATRYGNEYGVHTDSSGFANNYKTSDGKLFLGDQGGYYAFYPQQIIASDPPKIYITSFQLGDKELIPGKGSALSEPIYSANKITLQYNQSSFSIGFVALHYTSTGEEKYWYKLENYDTAWHDGASNKVYYFNLSPGDYIFHVKAMNSDGVWSEKKLSVIISPPWWQTWWAITLLALGVIAIAWTFYYYRSRTLRKENQLLEEKVNRRTAQLQQSIEELKSTQAQLIQSEKMASLGELTAGIAHEIQNPLNFVNNFSEVNKELVDELQTELKSGNTEEAIAISNDIKENEEKINHHGKRADSIVKGMLQHSRVSTGQKEPTDINGLCDEYLRLSYHGLRAKDKEFNATIKTDFDETIGRINIIPQDIGRVLLNLYNNAFYAISEKNASTSLPTGQAGSAEQRYEPTISVSTKRINDKIEIRVKDNGNGIPQKVLDKIFQPFFTTKPTGQGTGLGLSLSYDIIKAHGGEIKAESKEGEGSTFFIQLNA